MLAPIKNPYRDSHKFTDRFITKLIEERLKPKSIELICNEYNVCPKVLRRIYKLNNITIKNSNSPSKQVQDNILTLFADGASRNDIAKIAGLSYGYVSHYIRQELKRIPINPILANLS